MHIHVSLEVWFNKQIKNYVLVF